MLIVFGCSDDNVELRGVIHDEVSAWDGTKFKIDAEGPLPNWKQIQDGDESEAEAYFERKRKASVAIMAEWSAGGYSWFISATCPFEPFDIMEDGDEFCRGIVIDAKQLG